jgi:cbb3-type cytochrome oxidase subunit 3
MNDTVLNILRGAVTVTLFALFLALLFYVFSPRRARDFTAAANLIFDASDELPGAQDAAKPSAAAPHPEETR